MTPEEITALAREYAEEKAQSDREQGFPESFIKDMLEYNEKEFKSVLEFLLRRFCLVEKEAVRKEYESVKDTPEECNYEELGATWDEWPYLSRFYDEGYKLGKKYTVESLFPDLGKEVES